MKPQAKRGEAPMTLEYLLVNFHETRTVIGNGAPVGPTNSILMLPPGDYAITLSGDPCVPIEQDIELDGTSPVQPLTIQFS
jgi:hypothetical protein